MNTDIIAKPMPIVFIVIMLAKRLHSLTVTQVMCTAFELIRKATV